MKKVALWSTVIAAPAALGWHAVWSQRIAPVEVSIAKAERRDIVAAFVADGVIKTRNVHVSPKIVGRLSEIFVAEGERVAAGKLFARLDSGEQKSAVRAALTSLLRPRISASEADGRDTPAPKIPGSQRSLPSCAACSNSSSESTPSLS